MQKRSKELCQKNFQEVVKNLSRIYAKVTNNWAKNYEKNVAVKQKEHAKKLQETMQESRQDQQQKLGKNIYTKKHAKVLQGTREASVLKQH